MAVPAVAGNIDPARHAREQASPAWPSITRSRLKRALDIAGASVLLIATAPLAIAIAAAIRLDSSGPAVLRQKRCGLDGRPFDCLKFRSMHNRADDGPHRRYVQALVTGRSDQTNGDGVYKLVDDDRVTRVGRWLRRTSLDELPQLWNILKGDMSLVGPRPPLPYEVELYDERQHARLRCRPGLTGLWQVSGRNALSYRDMCELDLRYIEEWNHLLDVRILMRTLPVVFLNSGHAQ